MPDDTNIREATNKPEITNMSEITNTQEFSEHQQFLNKNDVSKMAEFYDFVIFGTGPSESILSAKLAKNSKVFVVDRNPTYGSEFATLSLLELEKKFAVAPSSIKAKSEFNIDLIPKLLLMESDFKNLLLEFQIDELVNFSSIKASYFYSDKLHSIPRSEASSLTSSAIGLFQKPKVISFFYNLRSYVQNKTGLKKTMLEEFKSFGLESSSMDFIGHAIAMHLDDSYLSKDPSFTYNRIVRYIQSIVSYDNTESPYIYPQYGLSDICQGFVRRASIEGAVFMLNASIEKINVIQNVKNKDKTDSIQNLNDSIQEKTDFIQNNYPFNISLKDPDGNQHQIFAKKIISDPSYFVDIDFLQKSRIKQEVVRCIMICKNSRKGSRSITFLKSNLNRKNDIFCIILDSETMACPEEYEIGILSTVKETDYPTDEILSVLKKFDCLSYYVSVRNIYENEDKNGIIFTKNVDASALMDNIYEDVEDVMRRIVL